MSLRIYVEGQRDDVERFFLTVIYPELGRLREDGRFRVTENNMKYVERRKKNNTVERQIRGYSPIIRKKDRPGLWERYIVEYEDVESKVYGKDLEKVTDVQVRIHLRSERPSEIKLFYDEFLEPKRDYFIIEKDTGIYMNLRDYASRFIGGHFCTSEITRADSD